MIGFAFCHGWSFDAESLRPLQKELAHRFPGAAQVSFDLGFTGAPRLPALAGDVDWIAFGHSYGFAWLMQQPQAWRGAIAVNGFTRFCRHPGSREGAPVRRIDAMLERLPVDAHAVVRDFQAHCGATASNAPQLDQEVLTSHLRMLRDLNLKPPAIPILALATSEDIVVPPALSRACFSRDGCVLHEFPGDHLQLLRDPAAAAQASAEFIRTIDA